MRLLFVTRRALLIALVGGILVGTDASASQVTVKSSARKVTLHKTPVEFLAACGKPGATIRLDRWANQGPIRIRYRDCDLRGVRAVAGGEGHGVTVPTTPDRGVISNVDYPTYAETFHAALYQSLDVLLEYRLHV